jgi:hypothetical protein
LSTPSPSLVTTTRVTPTRVRLLALFSVTALGLAACGTADQPPMAADAARSTQAASTEAPDDTSTRHQAMHDHGANDHPHMAHAHGTVETERDMAVVLDVQADAMAGWNIHIDAADFIWAPEEVNQNVVDGAGHAHLYIDGQKWGRVYTPWLHVNPDLTPGPHEFMVTLNANDHRDFTRAGETVSGSVTVVVPEPSGSMPHTHRDPVETTADIRVDVDAQIDARMGVNIRVTTTGFAWAPERASSPAVDGEGHAHLYLDGEKIGRLYGEWFHIARDLEPGDHEVRVTLNANDHRDYAVDGELVEATVTFTIPD